MWEGQRIVEREWVQVSTTPSAIVSDPPSGWAGAEKGTVQYGFQWWVYSYGKGARQVAWSGLGFGGQRLIALPEKDLIVVFTGWNILPDRPTLAPRVAIERILPAATD